MNQKLLKKFSKIKLVLTDVDGVLTDGGMYYSSKGDIMKKFHVRDGMGVNMLKRNNIPTIIVTKEKNPIIRQWAKKMNIAQTFDGIIEKVKILDKVSKKYQVTYSEILYIGDDINDIELLKKVGISVAPSDAWLETKKIVDYISLTSGGCGVFREISDLILGYTYKS